MKFALVDKRFNRELLSVQLADALPDVYEGLSGDDDSLHVHLAECADDGDIALARQICQEHDHEDMTGAQREEMQRWLQVAGLRKKVMPLDDLEDMSAEPEALAAMLMLLWLRVEALDCKSESSSR